MKKNTVNPPITRLIRTVLYGNRVKRNLEVMQIRGMRSVLYRNRVLGGTVLYGNRVKRNLEVIQKRGMRSVLYRNRVIRYKVI